MGWGDGVVIREIGVSLRTLRAVSTIAVVAFALDLSGCGDSPPVIGSHLPGTFVVASDAFDQRIKARFPVGSGESALRTELEREGFVTTRDKDSPFDFSARFHANELVCAADWVVRWSAVEGKIASIEARYKEVCL
jgi:hypothetical protein